MKKILIIDDNPLNVSIFTKKVKNDNNYFVEICMSLSDAERSILINRYDLIVIDIMMPTQNLRNRDELETGLVFYKEKIVPIVDAKKTKILFWSNLNIETYNDFFGNALPENTDFIHKDLNNENHLLEKINSIYNN